MPEVAVFTVPRRHRAHREVVSAVLALAVLTWLAGLVALASGTLVPLLAALAPTALWALLRLTRPEPVTELRVEPARLLAGPYRVPAHKAAATLIRERGELVLLLATGERTPAARVVLCRAGGTDAADLARLKSLAEVLGTSRESSAVKVSRELASLAG
ncbi:hypothetical protein Afil01_49820 [Actinorhabdospora filicis]|uniref:Uncharacterized protein n=1 Tax=Actinorhabdospora filicis TaxID=1785913 RepID=A0A9W6SQK3_9ACTN|nr:hypothetical protein [Actinorhabdospora filicis]GLZ80175.1 hypothetical protein Afil01_49820 [Actinorhabdospora filicis]